MAISTDIKKAIRRLPICKGMDIYCRWSPGCAALCVSVWMSGKPSEEKKASIIDGITSLIATFPYDITPIIEIHYVEVTDHLNIICQEVSKT